MNEKKIVWEELASPVLAKAICQCSDKTRKELAKKLRDVI